MSYLCKVCHPCFQVESCDGVLGLDDDGYAVDDDVWVGVGDVDDDDVLFLFVLVYVTDLQITVLMFSISYCSAFA